MRIKSFITKALLTVGLLSGCGGVDAEQDPSVEALACGGVCDRLYNRCLFLENRPADECVADWDACMARFCPAVDAAEAE
ncbi:MULTISPECIES: hypothetical protein [Myxococcus]|uniref:Lipoprotein n=1 Tax=Myxococcus llanfairpwllgwyngyllgogerychwyrndrobwllllantysiliogogogochensis TaxID=2590453 RepID=A0A540X8Q8_9BACT|nr:MULTISPECIES: hypothetical protein [Myxococcus]NTX06918.1 hypothetical protein [Myxococcus sp. CA040A]TQF17683.1 hypothetical protein FJV41_01555 [Myxococcus llanfairpwllgwyngyllgogerychwyrndrobwllllantysiliogogogochensis]